MKSRIDIQGSRAPEHDRESKTHSRRDVFKLAGSGAALAAGASAVGASLPLAAEASAATATEPVVPAYGDKVWFPQYRFRREPLDMDQLRYNPTGELIFPSIVPARGPARESLGRYLLYYGPHDAPGGICLAYADDLAGPFTEYPNNPVIANVWEPHYSVSHVASPHVLWVGQELYLYFHGENTETRLARSMDGVHFSYDRIVVNTAMVGHNATETSYARVFRHDLPRLGAHYVILLMVNTTANRRRIWWGWSTDARHWQVADAPLVTPEEVDRRDLAGPSLLTLQGRTVVVFHTTTGEIQAIEVGADFSLRHHLGIFHHPLAGPPDNGRSADPTFISDGRNDYMFYEGGARFPIRTTIAIASLERWEG